MANVAGEGHAEGHDGVGGEVGGGADRQVRHGREDAQIGQVA